MSISKKEDSILKNNGWRASASEAGKYVAGNGDWIKRDGNITNFGGVTKNAGISNSLLDGKSRRK